MAGAFVVAMVSRPRPDLAAVAAAQRDVEGSRELVARAVAAQTASDLRASLLEDSAHAAISRAAVATASSHEAQLRANDARQRFAAAAKNLSVECDAVVSAAEVALSESDSVVVSLKSANSQLRQGASELQGALDSTRTAAAAVRAAAVDLSGKAGILVKASKPSLIRRLLPHPGIGSAAGINAAGQPQVLVVAATLGWSF
jgi:hypothetical protein